MLLTVKSVQTVLLLNNKYNCPDLNILMPAASQCPLFVSIFVSVVTNLNLSNVEDEDFAYFHKGEPLYKDTDENTV